MTYRPLQPRVVPCRSCKARMFFARTPAGKAMPIDEAPVADGNLILIDPEGRHVHELSPSEAREYQGLKYQSHFRVCPDARAWRRVRGIPEPQEASRAR